MEDRERDLKFMKRAIDLARKGKGRVSPNPMVGAVITDGERIISSGYHKYFGGPHAEAVALKNLKETKKDLILYVNLEPCVHFGKTGPCVDEIIKSPIKKVFISTKDPNPLVNGKGIKKLEEAGIEVFSGILEREAIYLNRVFFYNQIFNMPYVLMKWAATLDGYIADRDFKSKWITSEKARREGKSLREEVDAILVGSNTVLRDNPHLDRLNQKKSKEFIKVVLDPKGKLNTDFNLFKKGKVFWILKEGIKKKAPENVEILNFPLKDGLFPLKKVLKKLKEKGVSSILLEGGSKTASSFLKEKLVQEVALFYSPKILGGGLKTLCGINLPLKKAFILENISLKSLEEDFYIRGLLCSLELLKEKVK
ncbi:MAG: bifunctional diaminohydroxyphosphoribosylaminopyrimidine deaminase/5-amino-6-(5-phosphoribosylamino)uracil reductase RibD [Thermoanaerobaculia bacterium]